MEQDFPFWVVITKTFTLDLVDIANFWLLFPLSGILLLSVRIYSYIIFISIQLYSLYFHLNYEPFSWPYIAPTPSSTAYLLLAANMAMVCYLLLPRSREIFFDKNLRWWERGSRYTINEPCFAKLLDKEIHGKVCDLSFGGALLELDEAVEVGSILRLDFELLDKNLSLNAQVIRLIEINGQEKYGTEFLYEGTLQKLRLKFLMTSIGKVKDYGKYR